MKLVPIVLLVLLLAAPAGADGARWVKGNTHAHTRNSDGNEAPRRVMRWYLDHDYQFLVISDHDIVTDVTYLDSDKNDDFILIPAMEITRSLGKLRIHVNALNPKRAVETAALGRTAAETLQNSVDAALAAGAVPQVNHPHWRWSLTADDLRALHGARLFELLNVNRDSNNFAAGGRPGTEELWDSLLSQGMVLYGVASDDTHDYLGDFTLGLSYPGKGWVMVRVAELTADAVCAALQQGDFYASTGVELADVQVTDKEYRLTIAPLGDTTYTTRFIGRNGAVLKEDFGLVPSYAFTGNEDYVRAKVVSSAGELAFCQPVFVRK